MIIFASSLLPVIAGSVLAISGATRGSIETVPAEPGYPPLDGAICASILPRPMGMRLRLAATRTEVPPGEIKAATPAPAFADMRHVLLGRGIGARPQHQPADAG
jgi:hypothetical protein